MTFEDFKEQLNRLMIRFGKNPFDKEFNQRVWKEVQSLNRYDFIKTVDHMIESRKHTNPPLLVDFREAVRLYEKRQFNRELEGAVNWHKGSDGLKKHLRDKKVSSVSEWLELERFNLQIAKAEGEG